MRRVFVKVGVVIVISLLSATCSDNAESHQPVIPEHCEEVPPKNEECGAYFVRWFYDRSRHICVEISYSGCSQKGFATQEECKSCK